MWTRVPLPDREHVGNESDKGQRNSQRAECFLGEKIGDHAFGYVV